MVKTKNGLNKYNSFFNLGVPFVVSMSIQPGNVPVNVCNVCGTAQNVAEICCVENHKYLNRQINGKV